MILIMIFACIWIRASEEMQLHVMRTQSLTTRPTWEWVMHVLFDGTRGLPGLIMEAEGEKAKVVGCPSETVSLV